MEFNRILSPVSSQVSENPQQIEVYNPPFNTPVDEVQQNIEGYSPVSSQVSDKQQQIEVDNHSYNARIDQALQFHDNQQLGQAVTPPHIASIDEARQKVMPVAHQTANSKEIETLEEPQLFLVSNLWRTKYERLLILEPTKQTKGVAVTHKDKVVGTAC